MSKSLYNEAIADAQKLRQLAEETAKNRVVEAVMPKIRDMVNRRILGEQDELDPEASAPEEDEETFSDESADFLGAMLAPEEDLGQVDMLSATPDDSVSVSLDDDLGAATPAINVTAQGDVNIELETSDDEEEVLTDTMAEALGRLIRGEIKVQSTTADKIIALEGRVLKLKNLKTLVHEASLTKSQKRRMEFTFLHCVREAINLRGKVILTEQETQGKLEKRLTTIIKELRTMSRSNRRNIFDFLFEGEEDVKKEAELAEAELNLELEPEETEGLVGLEDEESVDTALEDLLGGVELSLAAEEGVEGQETGEDVTEASSDSQDTAEDSEE